MGAIQKQGLINTIIVYVGVIIGFCSQILIQPHYLRPEELGLSRIMINYASLLTPFLLLGASSMSVRFFPAFKDKDVRHHGFFGFMLLFPLAGMLVGGTILWALRPWIESRYQAESGLFVHYLSWGFPLAAIMTLSIALNSYCNSLVKTVVPSLLNDVWVRVLLIAVIFAHAFGWLSLDGFVAGIFITYLTQTLFLLLYIFRIDRPGIKIDWAFFARTGMRPVVQFSLLMTLTALSSLSLKFLDSVMIGAYLPLEFVGIYSIAVFIAQFIETPLYSLERVAAVKIAHAFQTGNMEEVKIIYYRSVKYLFLLGGLLAVGIVCNIHDFLRLLPETYRGAANVTIIISIGAVFNMATGVNSPIITNSPRYIWNMYFLLILLATSVCFNLLLIPKFGMEGAAIATGSASLLFNLMKFLFIRKTFSMQPYDSQTLRIVVAIALSFAAGWWLPMPGNVWAALFLRSSVIVLVYGTVTLLLRIVPEYHNLLLRLLPKKR